MTTLLTFVLLAGGSLWAYRQWKSLQPPPANPTIIVPAEGVPPKPWVSPAAGGRPRTGKWRGRRLPASRGA